ncbi:hypothetical protein [Corynebacterium pygosceleis]|uniref:YbjN domain-containing protein n=1 Tax=Corynebacterium pygosceleis TaxID=2800406 RepID=A0A9Q4GHU0_9CORY|nr:hypothetical protein [Corynebacterium pygosceleis]MCK7636965.1 hypothetical protein [Corynebacterium pygosceleis]MCK7674439.1 hypothetical protein [Corynebacterium pygosceleis]MCL0120263.1 hypothetical protein [Corynebacterium pygosceleis]MCX7443810.1 hypothetical protein [Corynebacterium pygosceleis]MCX7467718.1 hypothetical protein [Corynebacterium pygosceleis]
MNPILETASRVLTSDGRNVHRGDDDDRLTIETDTWVLTFTVSDKSSLIASGMWKRLTTMEDSSAVVDLVQAWYTRGWDMPSAGYNTDVAPGHIVLVSSAALMCADRVDEATVSAFVRHALDGTRTLMDYAEEALPGGVPARPAFDVIPGADGREGRGPGIDPSHLHAVLSGLEGMAVGVTHGTARRGPVLCTISSAEHSPWYRIEGRWPTGLPVDDMNLLTMALHVCNEFTVSAAGPVVDFVTSRGEIILKATALVFCPGTLDDDVLAETLDRKLRWMQAGLHHVSDRLHAPAVCPLP